MLLSTWFNNIDDYGDDSFNYSSNNDEEPEAVDSALDIKDYPLKSCSDHIKYQLNLNREPDVNFKFPAKQYKDKRSKSGYMNQFCCRSWLKRFDYTCYSKGTDGLYCLACVLFPDLSHRRPNKLISEPYQNWKDAVEYLKKHAACGYHCNSMARLRSFKETYTNPSIRVDVMISDQKVQVEKNRQMLASMIKCLEFCGR